MRPSALTGDDLLRLEQGNYRRVTLLTAWTLIWLYVFCDLLIHWGRAHQVQLLQRLDSSLPAAGAGQVAIFVVTLLGIWLMFYALDDTFEQASTRSLCYRLGNLAHIRVFNVLYLVGLLVAGALALHYQIGDQPFWLLFTLLLISCLINFIESGAALRARLAWNSMRLRLMLSRVPGIRRFVSLRPVSDRLAQGGAPEEDAGSVPPAPIHDPAAAPGGANPAGAAPAHEEQP